MGGLFRYICLLYGALTSVIKNTDQRQLRTHLLEHLPSRPPNVDNNDLLHDQNWFTQHWREGEPQIQAGELWHWEKCSNTMWPGLYLLRGVTEGVSMVTNNAIFLITQHGQLKPLLKIKHGHKAFLQTVSSSISGRIICIILSIILSWEQSFLRCQ